MAIAQTDEPTLQKPLRLWPGVALAVLQCLAWFILPVVFPDDPFYGMIGTAVGGLAIVVWWAFFSRAPWSERVGAIVLMIVALYGTSRIIHVSLAKAGMGMLFFIYAIPLLSFVFVAGVVASRRLSDGPRRATMVATILLACAVWTLLRTGGISGSGDSDLAWRWSKTPEERLLAQAVDQPAALPAAPAALPAAPAAVKTGADWPGFRGPHRDGIIPGVRIETDWSRSPPVQMWRRPIGPGWSSFAVRGDLLYTQEQRGDDEVVACYNTTTGKPVWMHRDAARFWESNGGPGPRGTPTLQDGRVYTFGATGILNALDAGNGAVVWTRNAASDTGAKLPGWGFSSSPLVVHDLVIVAAAGRLAAYDLATGKPRWFGPNGGGGYSSPHLLTIDGVAQVLLMSGAGAISVAPADGKLLWEHPWPAGVRIVQPALASDGDVLMSAGDEGMGGAGLRRIAVAHGPGGWTIEERWTSKGLKPNFNDFVVHRGHALRLRRRHTRVHRPQGRQAPVEGRTLRQGSRRRSLPAVLESS
ncbi:MAG: PQQ-binding-like beta-propeller repeat protein, partial [Acidobacteria bacterium]|nr:PQQ-binding-like beta-propeller repeat protein [Acidobacteriota bacterium]